MLKRVAYYIKQPMLVMKKILLSFLFLLILIQSSIAQSGTNTINAGAKITEGQRLISANKNYYLAMQADGNLCIYTSANKFVWCSMLYLGKGSYLTMQTDGNLVVYDGKNQPVWNTMTQAFFDAKYATAEWKPVRAVLEDNGTLSLYTAANKKVWSSSDQQTPPVVSPGVGFTGPVVKKDLKIKLPGSTTAAEITVEINNRGEAFYHGDMNLGTLESIAKAADAPSKPEDSFKWPNSTVPYTLPANHPRKEMIQKGIDYLNNYTTICMVARTNQTDYVEFISRNGNWSALGRVGGKQEISLENDNIGTVIHEVMHALGFHHTQCREDRDNYVTIALGNVETGKEHNFKKSVEKQSNLGVYDYTSCMHYPSYGFAKRKGEKTIIRKDGKTEEMGQWDGMSATDVSNIALIYPKCSGKPSVKPLPTTTTTTTTTPTTTTTTTTNKAICEAKDAVKKYQTSMKPGDRLLEKEKIISANGRYQLRGTPDGNFVIEEVLSSGNCPYKEVFRFALNNGGSKPNISFLSYNPDGNICMDNKQGKTYCATTGRDATAAVILNKSVKLELTDDGRLRLVNSSGQEIWATSPAKVPTTTTNTRVAPTTTTTTNTRVAPTTTTTTSPIRTGKPIEPIVDGKKVVPIPAYKPGTGFINIIFDENGIGSQNVKASWWSSSTENAGNPQQAIDGNKTIEDSDEPKTCRSGEGLTPGWQIDLGQVTYVEYIEIWNSPEFLSLQDRNFYVTTGEEAVRWRPSMEPLVEGGKGSFVSGYGVFGDGGNGTKIDPLGPYKWDTYKLSFIIPIKRNVRILSISLQKDGISMTPLTLEEVEIYGKKLEPRRR